MQVSAPLTCPVCGRNTENREKCSFCGFSLTDQNPPAPAPQREARTPEAPQTWERRKPGWGPPPIGIPPYSPSPGTAPAVWFAGFWIRVGANLIDSFLLQILLGALFAVGIFGYSSGSEGSFSGDMFLRLYQMEWSYLVTVDLIVGLAYFTLFLGSRGQTPGKMLLRLKVIRTDGATLNYSQALLRTVGYYLIHYFTLNLGFLWVAFDPRKQGLHDKLARTCEIRLVPAEPRAYKPRFPDTPSTGL